MTLLRDIRPATAVLERPHGLLEGPRLDSSGEMIYSDVLAGGLWGTRTGGARVRIAVPPARS
jgi:hypothetical protein